MVAVSITGFMPLRLMTDKDNRSLRLCRRRKTGAIGNLLNGWLPDALSALIEEFVTRDGTDYGRVETPLETRKQAVMKLLKGGEAQVVFDVDTETCNVVLTRDLPPEEAP